MVITSTTITTTTAITIIQVTIIATTIHQLYHHYHEYSLSVPVDL